MNGLIAAALCVRLHDLGKRCSPSIFPAVWMDSLNRSFHDRRAVDRFVCQRFHENAG